MRKLILIALFIVCVYLSGCDRVTAAKMWCDESSLLCRTNYNPAPNLVIGDQVEKVCQKLEMLGYQKKYRIEGFDESDIVFDPPDPNAVKPDLIDRKPIITISAIYACGRGISGLDYEYLYFISKENDRIGLLIEVTSLDTGVLHRYAPVPYDTFIKFWMSDDWKTDNVVKRLDTLLTR